MYKWRLKKMELEPIAQSALKNICAYHYESRYDQILNPDRVGL